MCGVSVRVHVCKEDQGAPYSTEAPVHPTSALCNHPNLCMPSVVLSPRGGRCVQPHPFSLSALNFNAHTLCPMRRAGVNGVAQTSGFRGALLTREERAGFFFAGGSFSSRGTGHVLPPHLQRPPMAAGQQGCCGVPHSFDPGAKGAWEDFSYY